MASSKQTFTTYTLFDYFYDDTDAPLAGVYVYLTPTTTATNSGPSLYRVPVKQRARTDANGYAQWTVGYNPSGQEYTVSWPSKTVRAVITTGPGPFQVLSNLASDSA